MAAVAAAAASARHHQRLLFQLLSAEIIGFEWHASPWSPVTSHFWVCKSMSERCWTSVRGASLANISKYVWSPISLLVRGIFLSFFLCLTSPGRKSQFAEGSWHCPGRDNSCQIWWWREQWTHFNLRTSSNQSRWAGVNSEIEASTWHRYGDTLGPIN